MLAASSHFGFYFVAHHRVKKQIWFVFSFSLFFFYLGSLWKMDVWMKIARWGHLMDSLTYYAVITETRLPHHLPPGVKANTFPCIRYGSRWIRAGWPAWRPSGRHNARSIVAIRYEDSNQVKEAGHTQEPRDACLRKSHSTALSGFSRNGRKVPQAREERRISASKSRLPR